MRRRTITATSHHRWSTTTRRVSRSPSGRNANDETVGSDAHRFSRNSESVDQSLLVKYRPFGIGIVEHRPAADEARPFVDRPGGGMAVAGFQHQTLQTLAARQRFDALDDHRPDLASAMGRARIHAYTCA